MLASQLNQPRQERKLNALRRRVRREVDDQRLGPRRHARDKVLKLLQELLLIVNRHTDDVRAGNDRAIDMNRIGGIGHKHGVARIKNGQTQMSDALLRSNGDDGLGFGVELDAVTRLVPVTYRFAQPGQPARDGVAMRRRLAGRFNELVDDMGGRGAVGIAHAKVNDVFAAAARGGFHFAGNVENVSRQALNARELFHGYSRIQGLRD